MENRELTVDDLSSPVDESMQSEIQPAMSYFAEGGEVEQGLFSQQIPQRPTVQVPQQRLKRTASEMLQRMPQVPLGTMRFSPLSMPGILGRQIPRFAQGGEVDAEQRALMARQMDLGAPTENLFGANLSMPSLPPAVSFETNIPSFTPTYAPPTGPVTTPGTAGALGQYPGIGGGADLQYQQTLYEQLSPTTLAAPATTFATATGYTPTAQTTTRPTVLSREEAMLKQPTLVRYEPDVKFGGLTTYTGPLQLSPTTGGTDTTKTETGQVKPPLNVDRYALLGFRAPTEGGATGEGKYWFNPSMGYVYVPGGYTPEAGADWTEVGSEDFSKKINPEVPINWTDTNFFVTDTYKTPLDQPRVSNLTDVFKLIAGSDVSEAAQNLFKNPSYGWVPDPANPAGGTFSMTPEAVNNIRSSEPFKSAVSDTVKKLYNELGYTVGGEETTSTNVSEKDVANWANAISAGQTDIFRVANTITSPMRMSGQLQLTPDRPTLTSIYVNSGLTIPGHLNKAQIDAAYQKVLGRPADNAGLLFYAADPSVRGKVGSTAALEAALSTSREAQVQAAYRQALGRPADPAGLAYYTSGEGRNVDISAYLPTSREAQVRQAYEQVLGRAADTPGLQYYTSGAGGNVPISDLRTMFGGGERPPAARFRGSPPEGEYADPVAALRERMRMRREAGTMDQGTARDRLKKFLGGEDLAPVRMAEGGDVSRESQVRKVYQDVLGRAADEAGLQYYTTGEGKRYAAAQLADMFGASREGQIQKLYQNVLGRSTDPGGMEYYLRGEGRALTPDQIAEGFRGSEEYKSKQRTTAPAAVTTTKGPRPLTREGLLQEAMLFGGNSYNALGAYGPNSLNRRGYLTEKGRQQMINEIQPKAVADLIMRGQSVGLSPDEIQQAVQSGWQRGAESNRDFVVAEREAQANFVPEWFKIASALAGAHMMGTQILNQGASSLAPAASGTSVSSASVPVFGTPYTGMELGKIGAAAVQGYQNPNRANAANIVNTVFPSPFGALPRIEDIELFNQGGLVKRKDGSPEYGEIAIGEGGFTKDTLRGLRSGRGGDTFLSDSAKMLQNLFGEGVSNLESTVRGSVAAIPGSFGDIQKGFVEDVEGRKALEQALKLPYGLDKRLPPKPEPRRTLSTSEEVLRDYMPMRATKTTKETAGFEEAGTYLPLPVPAGTVTKTAGMVKTGARKALEELGPVAGTMLERTVPKFGILPEGPAAPKNLSERIDQGKFFKGRLDDFVSQLRNPVTKQQFLGSLKGKFREYEISRAAQALADLDDAAKLTPTDLASRISTVASPNRYKTTFIEPRDAGLHNRFDNVYGATGQPVGVINLSYEPTRTAVEAEEASAAARSAAAGLGRSTGDPEKIQTITSFLETSQELAKDPERKAQLLTGLKNLSNQLSTARAEITPVTQGLTDIVFANIPEFKGYSDKLSEAVKNISFPRNTPEYEEAFKNISKEVVNKIKVQALQRLYQEQPSLRTFLPLKEGETFEDLVRNLGGTNYVAEEMLPLMRKNLLERSDDTAKAILVDNMALLDDVLKETQRYSTYKGTHAAVNPEKNAMGFSRFTEHQVNVPGFGKLDGIYVSELQSDMFRDIKKLGKKGGSAAKDKQEITSLFDGIKAKLGPLKTQIEDRFGSMDSFLFVVRGDLTGTPKPAEFSNFLTELGPISKSKADQMAADLVGDLKRITKLQERLGLPGGQVKGTYSIEEPIANIERQPQVVQQMLIKNAVAGAMKMGKNFVAFPGVESSKAQLYEKLPNNLKAVLKDLGEGFVIEPIVIKDKTGVERTHRALIWDNNAAQRVLNNGVPFKKGGLVEKSAVDNRRYI